MSSASYIDELLSGLLDGKLSEDERRQLDELLQADSSIAKQLEQLRQIRADLQSLPQRRLKIDFATRVIEQARREAIAAKLPAGHHVLREIAAEAVGIGPIPAQATTAQAALDQGASWNLSSRLVASLAALAASILFVAYLANQYSDKSGVAPFANFAEQLGDRTGTDELAGEKSQPSDLASKLAADQSKVPASNLPGMPSTEMPPTGLPSTGLPSTSSLPVRDMEQFTFDLLFICDFKITQKAWDENVLGGIFEKAGIKMANPVFASPDITESLAETRAIMHSSQAILGSKEEVALIYVSASAKAVDKTMQEVWRQAHHFPAVALDMAFDRPDQELLKKLNKAIEGSESTPSATPILLTSTVNVSLNDVAQFSTAARAKFVSSEERNEMALAGDELTSPDEDATSYVLMVIRKPAE